MANDSSREDPVRTRQYHVGPYRFYLYELTKAKQAKRMSSITIAIILIFPIISLNGQLSVDPVGVLQSTGDKGSMKRGAIEWRKQLVNNT